MRTDQSRLPADGGTLERCCEAESAAAAGRAPDNLPRGKVFVVEDDANVRRLLEARLRREGFEVEVFADTPEAVDALARRVPDVVLTDLNLPSGSGLDVLAAAQEGEGRAAVPVVVLTAFGTVESAVQAVHQGAYDYLTKPADEKKLVIILERAIRQRRLLEENSALLNELQGSWSFERLTSQSPAFTRVLAMAREVARNPHTTVLLQGETGTGKEVLARAVHFASTRRAGRFVALHCGAIPDALLESELFGYERGAFTGATHAKKGKIELANGGTLFLDEIGDMPPQLQVKLLRVLQERCFERLGGLESIAVDVRVVAATHRNLAAMVRAGQFREDLYYRLQVFPLELPPLRERPEDIESLADFFLCRHAAAMGRAISGFTPGALRALRAHAWPGNVRELQNVIERAVILCRGDTIDLSHLTIAPPAEPQAAAEAGPPASLNLDDMERQLVERAMRAADNNQSEAARMLGITRWQLRTKLDRYAGRRPPAEG